MGRKINFNPPVWLVVLFDSLKAPIVWINVVGQGVNALADLNINPWVLFGFGILREFISRFLTIYNKQEIGDE